VLIDFDFRQLCRGFFDSDAETEFFLAEVLGEEFHLQRDRGVPVGETAAEWSRRYPVYASAIQEFCERFPEVLTGPAAGSMELLRDLRASQVGVYGLTNSSTDTWDLLCERYPFLGWLDGVVVSAEVGLMKPDPKIFELLCSTFRVTPEEAVFVDDVPDNVAAAQSVGFHGITFTTADNVRRQLTELGLLNTAPQVPSRRDDAVTSEAEETISSTTGSRARAAPRRAGYRRGGGPSL